MASSTPAIIDKLFSFLEGDLTSTLRPNIIETLYSVISGTSELMAPQCREFVGSIFADQNRMSKISPEFRQVVFDGIFRRASTDLKPKFKSLLQDFAKVCCGEVTVDVLGAHVIDY